MLGKHYFLCHAHSLIYDTNVSTVKYTHFNGNGKLHFEKIVCFCPFVIIYFCQFTTKTLDTLNNLRYVIVVIVYFNMSMLL